MSIITPRLRLAGFMLGLCGVAGAMAGEYLPWELNDQASYSTNASLPAVLNRVDRVKDGQRHFTAFASWGPLWLATRAGNERLLLIDKRLARHELMTDFDQPVGFSSWISMAPCNAGTVTIAAKDRVLDTPAGVFSDVVQLDLNVSCADGGISRMWFAPGVGLVQWTQVSLAGERQYQLSEGRIDDHSYPRSKGLMVSGSVPAGVVWINMMPGPLPAPSASLEGTRPLELPRLAVSLQLSNHGAEPLTYQFNSGQRYDIVLTDAAGSIVAQWSAGKAFSQMLGRLTLAPGDSISFADELELVTLAGEVVPEGNYSLLVYLASEGAPVTAHDVGSEPPAVRGPLQVRWAY